MKDIWKSDAAKAAFKHMESVAGEAWNEKLKELNKLEPIEYILAREGYHRMIGAAYKTAMEVEMHAMALHATLIKEMES